MNLLSKSSKALTGSCTIPGDKSISHRSIILGAIAEGTTVVNNFLTGEDCLATVEALRSMGVKIENSANNQITIHGVGKNGLKAPSSVIDCGNSGTSMRLLAGLLAAQPFNSTLIGDESLNKRPMARISKPLALMGGNVETNDGKPPLRIAGNPNLKAIVYEMPEASAQVKSCLLLAGLYAQGETTVIEPMPTRDHTENMLKTLAYPVNINGRNVSLNAESHCQGTIIDVPGDISSAAFLMVAALLIPNSQLTIENVGINPTRTGIIDILRMMDGDITLTNERYFGQEKVADIVVKSSKLKGITIPEILVPLAIDEFPIIFIAAACATGQTILHGAAELRGKESDRIGVMIDGLQSLGINAQSLPDGAIIEGGNLGGGVIESHSDHRIAMSFIIAGALSKSGITVKNCETISTSFPNFVEVVRNLNFDVEDC